MRILITNSVPLNGGDEALLRALIYSLQKKYQDVKIDVLCMNQEMCQRYLPDITFYSDLEYAAKEVGKVKLALKRFIQGRLHIHGWSSLITPLLNKQERKVISLYKKADLIISSPGGFLHDFYPISERLKTMELAAEWGKKVVICGQSVGPFWKPESKVQVRKVFKKLHRVYLRERKSQEYLNEILDTTDNLRVTADVAFLWQHLRPDLFVRKTGPIQKVALSFRRWNYENSDMNLVSDNAVKLCKLILKKTDWKILFLSTCQGFSEYVDDALLAEEIVSQLPDQYSSRIEIDRQRYRPEELISKYGECDLYVGMRLHGAILAMLGGTPAMGLGYEDKTKGIFTQMGFEKYQVDSVSDFAEWERTFELFIANNEKIRNELPLILDKMAEISLQNLDF